jgi:hypothetical protein
MATINLCHQEIDIAKSIGRVLKIWCVIRCIRILLLDEIEEVICKKRIFC